MSADASVLPLWLMLCVPGPLTSIQLVACNVQAQNTTIKIKADEGELEDPIGPVDVSWANWALPSAVPSNQAFLDPVSALLPLRYRSLNDSAADRRIRRLVTG